MLKVNKKRSVYTILDVPVGPWRYFDQVFEEPGNIYIGEDIFTSEKKGYIQLVISQFYENLRKISLISKNSF